MSLKSYDERINRARRRRNTVRSPSCVRPARRFYFKNSELVGCVWHFLSLSSFARAPARSVNEIIVSLLTLAMPDAFSSSFWAFVVQYFCFVVHWFFLLPFLSHISPSKCVFVRRRFVLYCKLCCFCCCRSSIFSGALWGISSGTFIDRKEKHEKL